jgi:23S rRNA (pseudouridine1915-N3)-methyltransferase
MRMILIAVGRARKITERPLFDDYQSRFNSMCRPLGLKPLELLEVEDRKSGPGQKDREASLILDAVPAGANLIALDEHGQNWTSTDFANKVRTWRDGGTAICTLVIGGADGLGTKVLDRADHKIAFGKATWPHMLVRAMLAEQVYRAATILSGHPYHRV